MVRNIGFEETDKDEGFSRKEKLSALCKLITKKPALFLKAFGALFIIIVFAVIILYEMGMLPNSAVLQGIFLLFVMVAPLLFIVAIPILAYRSYRKHKKGGADKMEDEQDTGFYYLGRRSAFSFWVLILSLIVFALLRALGLQHLPPIIPILAGFGVFIWDILASRKR